MGKKAVVFFVACLLILSIAAPVCAAGADWVADEAGLLEAYQADVLRDAAQDVSSQYGCGIYMVTVPDFRDFGTDVREAAENYFTRFGYGLGDDRNGVMLFLSMEDRDYALIAHGDGANTAFTDYGKDVLVERFLDDFRDDDWYWGFMDYVDGCEEFLKAAASGKPIDVGQEGSVALTVLMVVLIPTAIAGISCGVMVSSMKSVAQKATANDYILQSNVQLAVRKERFLNQTVVRQRIESESSGRSGGTTINSGGFSGKSGKF